MIWTPAKTKKNIPPNQPRRRGSQETPQKAPKAPGDTKTSLGALWKINSSIKSSQFWHLQKHRNWTPKTYQESSTIHYKIQAILRFGRPERGETLYNPYKKYTNSAQSCPKAPKRCHVKNQYETSVKVHIARTLCTRVRSASVETVCKVYRFRDTISIFAGVLQ